MNLTVSPQIRIVALVGLIAAIALGGGTMLLGRSSNNAGDSTTPPARTRVHRTTPPATSKPAKHTTKAPATRTKPHTTTTPATATKPATKTHTAAVPKTHHRVAAARHGNPVYATLPAPLQWQLSQHKVVVVSLYDPNANVDAIAVAEAHAGALDAHAGFLLVSVLDDAVAGPLTSLLPGGGLLPDPGILVYRAPGIVALRIDGFVDRQSVAQAATNVIAGETATVTQSAAGQTATTAPTGD